MGAPIAFTSRKKELGHIFNRDTHQVPSDDVTKSYLDSLSPEWFDVPTSESGTGYHSVLLKYLSFGQISLILGDNLFVHGAIDEVNMG